MCSVCRFSCPYQLNGCFVTCIESFGVVDVFAVAVVGVVAVVIAAVLNSIRQMSENESFNKRLFLSVRSNSSFGIPEHYKTHRISQHSPK